MAIIYTYPTKATPVLADLVLITDTESTNPSNQTKTATINSLRDAIDVVDKLQATLPIEVSGSTGIITVSSRAFGGGDVVGYVPSSAAANQNTDFLRADGVWAAPASGTPGSGTVTQVNAITLGTSGSNLSSTIASPTSTPTITLNVPDASGTARGALTSTDWTTFNNKQAALVSGTNIKTINSTSILGSGNISVTATAAGSAFGNIQYRDTSGSLGANTDLSYFPASTTLSLKNQIHLVGTSSQPGKIRIQCKDTSQAGNHYVEIHGPDHNNSPANYSIQLPNKIATQTAYSSGGRILESDASGILQWIATPTGSGGGISFSGSTANGLVTYTNATTATVNAQVKLLSSGQMTFDGSGGNVGILYGSSTLQVGDVGGNNENVEIHSNGAAKVTVAPALTTSAQLTQFTNGLRFGSSGDTLNSYEEGSWTPTSANANTISSASGSYVKIGKKVFAEFAFTMTGSAAVAISSLPFPGVYQSALKGSVSMSANNCDSVQGQLVAGQFTGGSTFTFYAYDGSGSGLPTKIKLTTSSLYQTSGGTYAGTITYTAT